MIERSTSSTPPQEKSIEPVSASNSFTPQSIDVCGMDAAALGRVNEVLAILLTAKKLNIPSFLTMCAMSLSAIRKLLGKRAEEI
jgi:hypothetical protein